LLPPANETGGDWREFVNQTLLLARAFVGEPHNLLGVGVKNSALEECFAQENVKCVSLDSTAGGIPRGESFDIVFLFDALDYSLDLAGDFNLYASLLAKDGVIIATLPPFNSPENNYPELYEYMRNAVPRKLNVCSAYSLRILAMLSSLSYHLSNNIAVLGHDDSPRFSPPEPSFLEASAKIAASLGNYSVAEKFASKLCAILPSDSSFALYGSLAIQHHRFSEGINAYRSARALNATSYEIVFNLAKALSDYGKKEEAIDAYRFALTLNRGDMDSLFNLGNLYRESGQLENSIESYREASALNPSHPGVLTNWGLALERLGRYDEAETNYRNAQRVAPDYIEAWHSLGNLYRSKNRFSDALEIFRQAQEKEPLNAETFFNIGTIHLLKFEYTRAIEFFQRAVELKPSFEKAIINLGLCLYQTKEVHRAIEVYRRGIVLCGDSPELHWGYANALLLSGDMAEGWKEYEWRFRTNDKVNPLRQFSAPRWGGDESIKGKTIFIYTEQGFGDAIQFIRYVPLLVDRGAKVVVECQPALADLFKSVRGLSSVVCKGDPLPQFDTFSPLLSLPMCFGTTPETIPGTVPFVSVSDRLRAKWKHKLAASSSKLKAGLVWTGSIAHLNDRNRSCPVESLKPLLMLSNVQYVLVQRLEKIDLTMNQLFGSRIVDYSSEMADFSDATALMVNMDVIITVDTAAAHLAGALGLPVWLMLPFAPDWRWMLDRDDSPWYPTMRLFRQGNIGDWDGVIARVVEELRGFKK
jgi:tetratricopeptide (TPR) repeat protein